MARWIGIAQERMKEGKLLLPENDSAESYLRQAERTDPSNATVQRMLRDIGNRLLADAREALRRQQLESARRALTDASRFGISVDVLASLQRDIDSAANSGTRSQYLRLALQRTRENQLLEPERDNAKYYVEQLQRLDPTSDEAAQAARTLALRLIERGNQSTEQRQFNIAVRLFSEARAIGFSGPELSDAENKLRLARNPPTAPSKPIVAAPKLLKSVAPSFPDDAANAGVEGWVDVGFRITAAGSVSEVSAVASYPSGRYANQFEKAAIAAIRQYQFEPRTLSDEVAQRMVVRVQFKLQ